MAALPASEACFETPAGASDEATAGALVLFAMGNVVCALPREAVRALLPLPRLDAPPGLPAPLSGFLNLGGTAVPVLEPARLLGLAPGEPHPYRHLILLERDGLAGPVALLVDRVADVVPPGLPLRPAEEGLSLGDVVAGAVEFEGRNLHLLDPGRLLLAQEAAILDALSRQAQERLARWEGAGEALREAP
ncbi:purine-binding chemotaxis protein CheW [Roseomonas rosea]|uniref:Purine-binding chemotaxis protein CheW n=1 Tax=Muricoccus roseus TaxID=198092 RepID=A0A1M6M9G2_9PROT|nr:chemotaxis protein CheW [Roseomonas rosea]SHJ80079.1 purine-binding chemotaxis protein CheW [Roseomonas rosea]